MINQIIYGEVPLSEPVTVTYTSPPATYEVPEIPGQVEVREPRDYSVTAQLDSLPGPYIASQRIADKYPANDKDSFKSIQQSGEIKMTNYHNGLYETENNLIPLEYVAIRAAHPFSEVHGTGVDGQQFATLWYNQGLRKVRASAVAMQDMERLKLSRPFYPVEAYNPSELDQAVAEVKSQVVADTLQSYDILTELAELKETYAMAAAIMHAVRRPLTAMSEFAQVVRGRNTSDRKKIQAISDKWMGYRYGIMPAVYSMQDIIKLVQQMDDVYRTCRSSRNLDVGDDSSSLLGPRDKGLYQKVRGTIKVRATSKTRFELGQLSRLVDQTGFNIAVTAWELVPYSFVADWFANVGDWLLAHTHLATPGVSSRYCYSTKKEIIRESFVRVYRPEVFAETTGPYGVLERVTEPEFSQDLLVRTETWKEYDRVVFDQTDVDFYVSRPYMSWKRWADTASLTFTNLNQALRRLK